jgi:phage gp45-like
MKETAARLRNIFCISELQRRDSGSGVVQVKTHNGKVLEKAEAFPYGFCAKAKSGRAVVFCQGGNYDSFEILPVMRSDDVALPELGEGDAALYTASGAYLICRESGGLELFGKNAGGVVKAGELKTQLGKLAARVDGIIDALKNAMPVPQDGGAAYKTQIVGFLSALTDKENFNNLESDKVMHGDGK